MLFTGRPCLATRVSAPERIGDLSCGALAACGNRQDNMIDDTPACAQPNLDRTLGRTAFRNGEIESKLTGAEGLEKLIGRYCRDRNEHQTGRQRDEEGYGAETPRGDHCGVSFAARLPPPRRVKGAGMSEPVYFAR